MAEDLNQPVALTGTSGLKSAFNAITSSIGGSINDLAQAFQTGKDAIGGATAAEQAKADAQKVIDTENQKGEIKKKADLASYAASVGSNPDAPSYIMNILGQRKLEGENDLHNRLGMIQKKMDTGLLDNPLEWAVNQFTLNGDIASYNTRVAEVDRDTKVMGEIQKLTSDQGVVLSQLDNGINETRLAGMNAKTQAEADLAMANSKMALSKLGLDVLNIRGALDERQFSNTIAYNNALSEQTRLGLAMSADQRAAESHKLDIEMKKWTFEDRKDSSEAKANLTQRLSAVLKTVGAPPMSWEELKLLPDSKLKDRYLRMMNDPDIINGRMGPNPYDAVDTANTFNFPMTPGGNLVREKLTSIISAEAANNLNWHQMKPGEQTMVGNKAVANATSQELKDIPDQGGIYSPPSLAATLTIPGVAALSIKKDLEQLAVPDKMYATKAQDVFTTALGKIDRGESDVKSMAAEISTLFKAVQVDMNTTRQYQKLALQPLDAKTGYYSTIYSSLMGFGGAKTVNMINPVALEAELTRALLQRSIQKGMTLPGAGAP